MAQMCPVIWFMGRAIPAYGLLGVLGVLAGLLLIVWRCRQKGLNTENAIYIYILSFVGAFIGAKLLYLLTVLPQLLQALPMLHENPVQFIHTYLAGGLVYYGGLVGGILTAYWTSRSYHVRLGDYYPALLPALAVFSGFGRVGCFLSGCCYGVETSLPIGVIFPAFSLAPSGVPLVPVQLLEAGFDFLLCGVMIWLTNRKSRLPYAVRLYVLLYAAARFVLEFFRGDGVRGSWLEVSTSQWISLVLLLAAGGSLIHSLQNHTQTRE